MMNRLRLMESFNFSEFEDYTGLNRSALNPALQQAEQKGLISVTAETGQVTELGHRYLNELLTMFMD